MARPDATLIIRVRAIHVRCRLCTEQVRIATDVHDGFTEHILRPLQTWVAAHMEPQLVAVEKVVVPACEVEP